jgi:hypothetical protein
MYKSTASNNDVNFLLANARGSKIVGAAARVLSFVTGQIAALDLL